MTKALTTRAGTTSATDLPYMPLCAVFRRFLKRKGLKFTHERAVILDAVLAREGVFDAEELSDEIKAGGRRVSKATVYRTLKHLVEAQIVEEVLIDSRQVHFQQSFGRDPKGHLACLETNQIVEFPTKQLDEMAEKICREYGFDFISHRFVIYGVSPQARKLEQDSTQEH